MDGIKQNSTLLLYAARGVRGFGDGFAVIILDLDDESALDEILAPPSMLPIRSELGNDAIDVR